MLYGFNALRLNDYVIRDNDCRGWLLAGWVIAAITIVRAFDYVDAWLPNDGMMIAYDAMWKQWDNE